MSTGAFDRLSRGVASKFLNTVVVVDDQALLAVSAAVETPGVLKTPGRQAGTRIAGPVESAASTTDSAHRLDAKKLTDSFARIGVVCSVLRPEEHEMATLEAILSPVAASSDVVILDWVLHEFKQGEKTIEIIRDLLKSSGPDRGRARLIIIYTGETDLDKIVASIRTALNLSEQASPDPFTIERGAARICVYAKEQSRLPAAMGTRKIEIAKLPDIVVDEFANMTRGLVSNVALSSLAALRANTYQLLKRFHRELDAPYVTHSTLLVPEEASDHLIPLIVSEIQAVLEDARVSDLASLKRVVSWLNHQVGRGLTFTLPQHTSESQFFQGLAYLLEHGLSEKSLDVLFRDHAKFSIGVLKSKTKKKAVEIVRDQLTRMVTLERDHETVSDHELATLMSLRFRYASPPPHLTLGSVVLETHRNKSQYLLCVQPRCDSVRLECERSFPFLPMQPVKEDQRCDLIIDERGKVTRLRLNDKPFDVRMVTFTPGSDTQVVARRVKSGRFFKGSKTTSKYRWIADLKPEHAQRIANEYAHKISRVGLTESEWLRKWMPGPGD